MIRYVAYWHKCEVCVSLRNVRVRRRSGRHPLGVNISHFDPSLPSALHFVVIYHAVLVNVW
jgi:hypothetical protein